MVVVLVINQRVWRKAPQQSVHLTLGILRRPKPFSPLWSFFYSPSRLSQCPSAGNASRSAACKSRGEWQ